MYGAFCFLWDYQGHHLIDWNISASMIASCPKSEKCISFQTTLKKFCRLSSFFTWDVTKSEYSITSSSICWLFPCPHSMSLLADGWHLNLFILIYCRRSVQKTRNSRAWPLYSSHRCISLSNRNMIFFFFFFAPFPGKFCSFWIDDGNQVYLDFGIKGTPLLCCIFQIYKKGIKSTKILLVASCLCSDAPNLCTKWDYS